MNNRIFPIIIIFLCSYSISFAQVQFEVPETEAMNKQDELGWPIFASEDSKEGMKAFKEKRKAVYKGK